MQDTLDLKGTVGQFLHEYKKALWDSYDDEDMRRDATFMDHYGSAQKEGFGIAMKRVSVLSILTTSVYLIQILLYIVMPMYY